MSSASGLIELAQSLIEHGPRKTLQTSRRLRAVHNQTTIVDTTHGVQFGLAVRITSDWLQSPLKPDPLGFSGGSFTDSIQ